MVENLPIMMLEESEKPSSLGSGVEIISLDLDILGEPLRIRIAAWKRPATLADIVPMARALSSKIVQAIQRKLNRCGITVPCHKGCTVCCYYIVSVSVPEAFCLIEETMRKPLEQCDNMIDSFSIVATKIQKYLYKYKSYNMLKGDEIVNRYQVKEISDWYFKQKLPCPFLDKNLCTIYKQRPMSCREHWITGHTSPCVLGQTESNLKVDIPLRPVLMGRILKTLTSSLEITIPESVILPCIFDWYTKNFERSKHTWPATTMVKQFVKIVKVMELQNKRVSCLGL